MIIAEYTFNSDTDTLPTFNDGFTYNYTDVDNGDSTITRTIESNTLPTSMNFYNSNVITINYLNTSELTEMLNMFNSCRSLISVNAINWDTSKVTIMSGLFNGCVQLSTLDGLENWDTSNVTNTSYMFYNCNNLTELDLSNWDVGKVTNMGNMFTNCKSLTSLDVSNWNTGNVTAINHMFNNCTNLASLDLSSWNTSKVTTMSFTFSGCSNLASLDLSNGDTSKVTTMNSIFKLCNNLKYLDISNFKINSNCNTTNMFQTYGIENIGMLHCDNYTVNTVANNIGADSTIWVQDTKAYEYEDTNDNGIIKFRDYKEQEIGINLPQPLRAIGNYKDKLYWNNEKGKYCIEQKVLKITANDLINDVYGSLNIGYDRTNVTNLGPGHNIRIRFTNSNLFYSIDIIGVYNNLFPFENNVFNVSKDQKEAVYTRYTGELVVCIDSGKLGLDFSTSPDYNTIFNSAKEWLKNSGLIMYAAIQPIIIETDITEKINFDTYNDSMYIAVNDSEVSPSNISTIIAMKEEIIEEGDE